jgi:catechol 2,3-dioxygenase-like lactoylglutathione lyase family enzyme
MITKINVTVLFVRDFDASLTFYRDTLGFKVKDTDVGFTSFDMGGHELALMALSNAAQMIDETTVRPAEEGVHRALLAAFVDNTDEEYESLTAKGVKFVKPPTTQPWGQRTAYFSDPDGNIWEISHFLETK